jgi:hypothetical protein
MYCNKYMLEKQPSNYLPCLEEAMSVRERVAEELTSLSEDELRQVADYISFLRFRARRTHPRLLPEAMELTRLYQEAADEDRELAEHELATYAAALEQEDQQ